MLARVEEMTAREKEMVREIRRLTLELASADAERSLLSARSAGGLGIVRRVLEGCGGDYVKAFAEGIVARPDRVAIVVDQSAQGFQWLAAHSAGDRLDLATLLPPLYPLGGCKGGGRGARMQGMGSDPQAAERFAQAVEEEIARRLS